MCWNFISSYKRCSMPPLSIMYHVLSKLFVGENYLLWYNLCVLGGKKGNLKKERLTLVLFVCLFVFFIHWEHNTTTLLFPVLFFLGYLNICRSWGIGEEKTVILLRKNGRDILPDYCSKINLRNFCKLCFLYLIFVVKGFLFSQIAKQKKEREKKKRNKK